MLREEMCWGKNLPWEQNVFYESSILLNYNGKNLHGEETSVYEITREKTSSAKKVAKKIT